MTDNPDLWEVRNLPGGLALVLAQGEDRVRIELSNVRPVVAGLSMLRPTWLRSWLLAGCMMLDWPVRGCGCRWS
jgi:hypothetical protein